VTGLANEVACVPAKKSKGHGNNGANKACLKAQYWPRNRSPQDL